ncbi:MAG: hypothetical protein JNN04_02050 [Cyclobacteriaceae bacterium]|nr:hypothetical protein [Cyclobacteriaceae bacterium]
MNIRYLFPLILILAGACGGKLTQEERAKLHEGMATQDIRRVTDAELQEAALSLAGEIVRDVERIDKFLLNKTRIDSLAAARGVVVYPLRPDSSPRGETEKQLIEAYMAAAASGTAADNLQKLGTDSMLFTRPVYLLHPDGSQELSHAIGIRLSTRSIVLSMPQP